MRPNSNPEGYCIFSSGIRIAPDAVPANVSGFNSTVPADGADSIPCSETGLNRRFDAASCNLRFEFPGSQLCVENAVEWIYRNDMAGASAAYGGGYIPVLLQ